MGGVCHSEQNQPEEIGYLLSPQMLSSLGWNILAQNETYLDKLSKNVSSPFKLQSSRKETNKQTKNQTNQKTLK